METDAETDLPEFTKVLIHSRRNVSPRRLIEPGPSASQLQDILGAAAAAPDHGQLLPWRFVIVPAARRALLGEAFALALQDRDPNASAAQVDTAREKAHRAPFLMLVVARLSQQPVPPQAAPGRGARQAQATQAEVNDAERLVTVGCAIQNVLLSAHAAGFGTGLTSGQALGSARLRALFELRENEQAVCCINIGSVAKHKPSPLRPQLTDYVSELS